MITLVIIAVLSYTICIAYETTIGVTYPGLIHFSLFWFFVLCSAMPFKILFHQTRAYFWKSMLEIFKTPFVDVVFEHFFIADQLTSCGVVFLDVLYALSYYFSGTFLTSGIYFIHHVHSFILFFRKC
jgi:hypothetical protein